MKIIGLIGGFSWVSTSDYYKLINEGINERLGGLNYAQCVIYSYNFAEIKKNNDTNDWGRSLQMMIDASRSLKQCGAEAILLCANTMHLIADQLQAQIDLPVIHVATVTATAIKKQNLSKVGLLGTKFTMERDFFKDKLREQQIETIIPDEHDREFVHYTIFEELGRNIFKEETKRRYLAIIDRLIAQGAQGIVLGCTEIPMMIKRADTAVPLFPTTDIHAAAAVDFSLS